MHESGGTIGIIPLTDDNIFEERTVGVIEGLKIDVFDDEGDYIPHFHLSNKSKSIDCCITIAHSRFFNHSNHNKRFTDKKIAKKIDKFMRKDVGNMMEGVSNWVYTATSWSYTHPFQKDTIQPDYTKLFENPYEMIFSSSIQKKSSLDGYTIYEGEIKERSFTKSIIVTNNPINNNSVKVEIIGVIEENFSNNEIFICKPKDDRVKVSKITSFSQDVANKYLRLKQHQFVSEKDYTG